jgi:uncharacterized protein
MTVTVHRPTVSERRHDRRLRVGRMELATVLSGAAIAVLVAIDGSPTWRVARAVAVAGVTAVVVAGVVRLPSRWRGAVAAAAGIPAVAIAVGFVPHLVKGGPLPIRAATVVLAVAALGLVVAGTAEATRGRRWWLRAPVGIVVFVITATGAFVIGPAVAVTNVPHAELGVSPRSVGLDHSDVTLRTPDGVSLAAWYVESSNGAAVVLRHGAGSTRSGVLDEASVLADAGYGVLMVDARGHGASDGRAMDFGWHGDADVAAATEWLSARPEIDPDRIGALGLSMGGEEVVGASGTNPALRAVVAEGATARVAGDEAWLSDRYGLRGLVTEQLEKAQDLVTDLLTSASPPASMRAAVASSDARYLFVTAGAVATEGHAADHVASAAPERVEVWTVAGAGHTGGLAAAPEAWADRVLAFLDDALGPHPNGQRPGASR